MAGLGPAHPRPFVPKSETSAGGRRDVNRFELAYQADFKSDFSQLESLALDAVDFRVPSARPGFRVVRTSGSIATLQKGQQRSFRHTRDPKRLRQSCDVFRSTKWLPVRDPGDTLSWVNL